MRSSSITFAWIIPRGSQVAGGKIPRKVIFLKNSSPEAEKSTKIATGTLASGGGYFPAFFTQPGVITLKKKKFIRYHHLSDRRCAGRLVLSLVSSSAFFVISCPFSRDPFKVYILK
jgi:hypothetical protein